MSTTVVVDKALTNDQKKPEAESLEHYADYMKDDEKLAYIDSVLPGEVRHRNYLGYLEHAWANHQGVVLSPDVLWYTLLCESRLIIAEKPETYRKRFTTAASGKTDIKVPVGPDITRLPLDRIIAELKKKVPNSLTGTFLPDFSTTEPMAREAQYAAFADAVSPYYNYMTLACGIPMVRLEGTHDDWKKLKDRWALISDVLVTADAYCLGVFDVITQIVHQFVNPDPVFMKEMFYLKRCGSGHQTEAFGWFTKLFRNAPKHTRYVQNFSSHVSRVKYTNLDTGRKFQMQAGVFGSAIEDGFMIPKFGRLVFEEKA